MWNLAKYRHSCLLSGSHRCCLYHLFEKKRKQKKRTCSQKGEIVSGALLQTERLLQIVIDSIVQTNFSFTMADDDSFKIPDLDDTFEDRPTIRLFRPGTVLAGDVSATKPSSESQAKQIEPVPAISVNVQPSRPIVPLPEPSTSSREGQSNVANRVDIRPNAIIVNKKQKDNPLLKQLRLSYSFDETIKPDYVLGRSSCAFFLSLRYHNLYPNYIYERFNSLGHAYSLRVLLLMIDVDEVRTPLKELTKFAIMFDCTLMVCWSFEEAASKYIR